MPVVNAAEVGRDFTAQDQSSDTLKLRLNGLHHVSVHILAGLTGAFVIEARRPDGAAGNSPFTIIETYSTFPVWKTVEIAGGWDFRLRCSAYSSGDAWGWVVS